MRVRLDLAYDGTGFSGWAPQPDRRTVAGELARALTTLFGADGHSGLTVAGRTDAGVHATGQVCHVDVSDERWQELSDTLVRRLAALLPPDVRVTSATAVSPEFDARFSALRRTYRYRVGDAPYGVDPLRRHDTLAWPRPLSEAAMTEASAGLIGEHDFAAYCRRREGASTVRTLLRLDWHRDEAGVLVGTVVADAFCHAMVRSLVGALLAVGDGRRPVDWPASLLSRSERADEVQVAPPHGLTLVAVDYPATPAGWAAQAERARRWRGTGNPPHGDASG